MIPVDVANYFAMMNGKCQCGKDATMMIQMDKEIVPLCEECWKAGVEKGKQIVEETRRRAMETYGTTDITREQLEKLMPFNSKPTNNRQPTKGDSNE